MRLLSIRSLVPFLLAFGLAGSTLHAELQAWTERETRLANQYLSLLGEQPEYGRVLDLLWELYEKHDSTALLLQNIEAQAKASNHPSIMLVRAHLVRRSGDPKAAIPLYEAVLEIQPNQVPALRSLADLLAETNDGIRAFALRKQLADLLPESSNERARAWIDAGHLALLQELPEEAAAAWEEAAATRPEDVDLIREVARLLIRAGKPDRGAHYLDALIEKTDSAKRLDALLELARVHVHADDFERAGASLQRALEMLHFRDARYASTFLRWVRLHEQFGHLETLRATLVETASAEEAGEKALADAARFFAIVVEPDERIERLRRLVSMSPGDDGYRWELVNALLAHEGTEEAAGLLDERLRGDGSDVPAVVFLRCDAHLRSGEFKQAEAALEKLIEVQGGDLEIEKQVLNFARQRALDDLVREILITRVQRRPNEIEAVLELAAFHRARRETAPVKAILDAYVQAGTDEPEQARRRNEAADFLASGTDVETALEVAMQAAEHPQASRPEWIRLADLLTSKGDFESASDYLQKAWEASSTYDDRRDVDERFLSVLMGGEEPVTEPSAEPTGEFQLPAAFTGQGFASADAPTPPDPNLSESVRRKAAEIIEQAMATNATGPLRWRGAWWALAADDLDQAYALLRPILIDEGAQIDPSLRLECESLLLDVAQADSNRALIIRQLRRLISLDAAREIPMTLRLAEELFLAEQQADSVVGATSFAPGREATELLEGALRRNPQSEQLLSAITRIYMAQGRGQDAIDRWKAAANRAQGAAAVPLLERYAELLLSAQFVPQHIEVQMDLLQREADVKRRREAFRRFLDRLAWPSAEGGSLSPTVVDDRMRMVSEQLRKQMIRHPFDAFYHEALAGVYQRMGDHAKAFAEMKQAYYTAPETPFSLHQLRDAAMRVNDLEAAIYFQKQIAATAPGSEIATESRRLVELLEQTFDIAEADRVRLRLENRFSQDSDALDDLAEYYENTGQGEAEARILERLVRVRPWDVQTRLKLGLQYLDLAREAAAVRTFERALDPAHTPAPPATAAAIATAGRVPLPLIDSRKPSAANPLSELVWQLDSAQGLTTAEVSDLRGFLSLPRPELQRAPAAPHFARLRVIEELAKWHRKSGGTPLEDWQTRWQSEESGPAIERFWALMHSGDGEAARDLLPELIGEMRGTEAVFCEIWMRLVTHGMEAVTSWTAQTGIDGLLLDQRQRVLQACISMLVDLPDFRFGRHELATLGDSHVLRNSSLLELTRKLQDRGRYEEALALGDTLRRNSTTLATDYAFFLSRVAESAQRWDIAHDYLAEVLGARVSPGTYRGTYDAFLFSLGALDRLAVPLEEREQNLGRAWDRLQRTPDSGLTSLRRSAITGMSGSLKPAADRLEGFLLDDLLTSRQLGEDRGGLMPQSMSRSEEPLFLRTFWEEAREIGNGLTQQGLGELVDTVNDRIESKWGGVLLSSQTGSEFHEWRLTHLIQRLVTMSHPERLRVIREHLSTVDMTDEDSVDIVSELGGRLEATGMPREAAAVYQLLPKRAPSNPDYAQWLIRACEGARMVEPGKSFTLGLLLMDPPLKPAQLGDETLRENHARFLAMDFDTAGLERRGFLDDVTVVRIGRIPPEVPYLRELAKLQARFGHDKEALEAWERLHTAMASNVERGLLPDTEACLERARYLEKAGRPEAALATLREIELQDPFSELDQAALKLRASLLAKSLAKPTLEASQQAQTRDDSEAWNEFSDLMMLAVKRQSADVILDLAGVLAQHQRIDDAISFLIQSERTLKTPLQRHRLRAERLQLASRANDWTPLAHRAEISALFRHRIRQQESLENLVDWVTEECKSGRADAWRDVLRREIQSGGDPAVAAMVASAVPGFPLEEILAAWQEPDGRDIRCLQIAAEHLHERQRSEDAWLICRRHRHLAAELDGVARLWPLMVRVAAARNDSIAVKELFAEALRLPFSSPEQATEWARAFEDTGHAGMASELLTTWRQRLESRGESAVVFFADWADFLIRQNRLEEAETFLLNRASMISDKAPRILIDLYTAWDRLEQIESELPKFHLASGIEKELLFLVRSRNKQP